MMQVNTKEDTRYSMECAIQTDALLWLRVGGFDSDEEQAAIKEGPCDIASLGRCMLCGTNPILTCHL